MAILISDTITTASYLRGPARTGTSAARAPRERTPCGAGRCRRAAPNRGRRPPGPDLDDLRPPPDQPSDPRRRRRLRHRSRQPGPAPGLRPGPNPRTPPPHWRRRGRGARASGSGTHVPERAPARTCAVPLNLGRTGRRVRVPRFAQVPCMSCMFFSIAASTARSSSVGLNWTSSLPAFANGTWPGGR